MATLFDLDEVESISDKISIYVLKLENNKYYVGQALDVNKRFKQHLNGKLSSEWTKLHKPICIYRQKKTKYNKVEDAIKLENITTIWCMKKFGWENVRGGDYCTLKIDKLRFLLALNSDLNEDILPIKVSKKNNLIRGEKYIFVLELSEKKIFVSYTTNIFLAILNEYNGLGSDWTKKYKPIKLLSLFVVNNSSTPIRILVNKFTENCMGKYGFNNVRGGDFFNLDERKHKNKVVNYTNIFI